MKLVFLYGPPAVGKLTVAIELAVLSGFKLFHNHLSQDLAGKLYPEFDGLRFGLVTRLRLDVIGYAAEHDTSLISTFVYSGEHHDDEYIAAVVKLVESNDGSVHFVELRADHAVIIERVTQPSRKKFDKLNDAATLSARLKDGSFDQTIPYNDVYSLDVTTRSPIESAHAIVGHFSL
jgi:hypothetical protein